MTALVALLIKLASNLGVKAASALIPYAVALTPLVVLLGGGTALYMLNKGNTINLVLMAWVAVNEAALAAQLAGWMKPAAPAK